MAQIFIFQLSKPLMAFFWAPIDQTKSIDKQVKAFRHIASKKILIHEKFDETNSEHEKKSNLIEAKKAPR